MILPKVRDPRFVMICRGGTLTDSDHHLLALWAPSCAEHVLDLFESAQPDDPRPRERDRAGRFSSKASQIENAEDDWARFHCSGRAAVVARHRPFS